MGSIEIASIWDRIEKWLGLNATVVLESLNVPAIEPDIRSAEHYLGVDLPIDFRSSLLIHNGQIVNEYDGSVPGLIDGFELLSLPRVISEHKGWGELLSNGDFEGATAESQSGIRCHWWNPMWIPIASDGTGDNYCIDYDPTEVGNVGQIILVFHDSPLRRVIAKSFGDWLRLYSNKLWADEYAYSDEIGGIIRIEDL
jgi:cell wall assembly regulator SMI1